MEISSTPTSGEIGPSSTSTKLTQTLAVDDDEVCHDDNDTLSRSNSMGSLNQSFGGSVDSLASSGGGGDRPSPVAEASPARLATPDPETVFGATSAASMHAQLHRLMTAFPETTSFGVCQNADGSTKSCCVAAGAFLQGAVMASSAKHGIPGVLDVLQTKWKWGIARCWKLCECFEQTEVDCGVGINISLSAVRLAPEVVAGEVQLCRVQVIRRWNKFQADQHMNMYPDTEDKGFLTTWIEDDLNYHQCIGLLNKTGLFRIWDFGKWHLPTSDVSKDRAILAVKVTPDAGKQLPATLNWMGHQIVTGEWATLLPAAMPATGIPNCGLYRNTLSRRQSLAVLEKVFENDRTPKASRSNSLEDLNGETADDDDVDVFAAVELGAMTPEVIVSGNHMSANPCPGVGCSRAIRQRFPAAKITAIDQNPCITTGMADVTFDGVLAIDMIASPHIKGKDKADHWRMVVEQLQTNPEALFLPCTDKEIDLCSEALETATEAELAIVKSRLLCPPQNAVEATEKPQIAGAKAMGIFEVPKFMTLDSKVTSQTDIETFCKREGYPVLIKGAAQGATVCNNWTQVVAAISSKWGADGFVQAIVTGFQLGVAFAAFEGELTGAVLMEKTAFNAAAKAWAGQFRPCPAKLTEAIRTFCLEYNWTGGAELEFIEDCQGVWHAIDWNPRFPAWIFAGCYVGSNLPAALVQHALHQRTKGVVPFPTADSLAGDNAQGAFTRTVLEIPVLNIYQPGMSGIPGFATSGYTKGGGSIPTVSKPIDMLPPGMSFGTHGSNNGTKTPANLEEDEIAPDTEDRETLRTEVQRLLPVADPSTIKTPCFVLSRSTVHDQLMSHKNAVQAAVDKLDTPLELKMCLSVKTQPHPVVLAEAKACGYLGEVITTAEMRGCLDAGWPASEVVMNGPGKWYDTPARCDEAMPTEGLRCLFADSIADLVTIVDRVLDASDWLDAEFIGVRFAPVWVAKSRFGIDGKDPKVLQQAADQIQRLPKTVKFGVHMHFASSKVGPKQWCGLATGYVALARGLADMVTDRDLTLLDFGGGWAAHVMDTPEVAPMLVETLRGAQAAFPGLEVVQFEPGKAITERAGGILTKVLEIREKDRKVPRTRMTDGRGKQGDVEATIGNGSDDGSDDDDDDDDENREVIQRAAVVDACISDMGSMPTHAHPLLWKSKAGGADWEAVKGGKDEVWGSICMEFDKLGMGVTVPDEMKAGDHVMIAFCGAYDFTMAYEFADAKGRPITIVE